MFLENSESVGEKGFAQVYFSSLKEAKDLMNSFGLQQLEVEEYKKWLEICYKLGQDENIMGTSEYFLYIGYK